MKRLGLFLCVILSLIIFVSGCGGEVTYHNYTFKGENEKWEAQLHVDGKNVSTNVDGRLHYETESRNTFALTYKGNINELKTVKKLNYSYESSAGGSNCSQEFETAPVSKVFTSNSSSKGGAIERKDEVIKVVVDVDGVESSLDLVCPK